MVCVLLLAGYHNVRKDKEFLRTLTPHLSVFLIKEYTLIVLPFAGIEIIKGQFTDAIAYAVRRLITFPERNKTETQSCPSSFSLQRKL